MSACLIDLLMPLTARERLLLACAAVVALMGLGFGLLAPLHEHRQRAASQLDEARALEQWITARVAQKQALNQGNIALPATPIGISGIGNSLVKSHLRGPLSALSAQQGGAIDLRFDRVDFIQLGQWLNSVHPQWGYRIDGFRLEALEGANEAGRVAAWITLTPRMAP